VPGLWSGCLGAAGWFGVPVGNGRPFGVELTDLQGLSLLASRDPAVGGSGTGPVGTECQSARVTECRSAGVAGCGVPGCLGAAACFGVPVGNGMRSASNSLTHRVCRCGRRGDLLSAAVVQRARQVQSAEVPKCRSAEVPKCRSAEVPK
jgi:hypothetical protein